ncbi:hypothetical protein Xmau_02099 [Xenorhabdus mauleonii]|uniref:Uncharacterized protein n=1 Tax=Xenorhabdus mauleonii TaxID=351675 RepID=A0A2G0P014_9GAMM|nr:hypothetical protein Xmau_02099 [Xenorhabdus mauleonii]
MVIQRFAQGQLYFFLAINQAAGCIIQALSFHYEIAAGEQLPTCIIQFASGYIFGGAVYIQSSLSADFTGLIIDILRNTQLQRLR